MKNTLLECPTYKDIKSNFEKNCKKIELHTLLTRKFLKKELGNFIFNLSNHKNNITNQIINLICKVKHAKFNLSRC